jgi:hypothetical protein
MSYLADAALCVALLITSMGILRLRRRLQRHGRELVGYRQALLESSVALEKAAAAVEFLVKDGHELAVSLAAKIEQARAVRQLLGEPAGETDLSAESHPANPIAPMPALHRWRQIDPPTTSHLSTGRAAP